MRCSSFYSPSPRRALKALRLIALGNAVHMHMYSISCIDKFTRTLLAPLHASETSQFCMAIRRDACT